MGKSKGFFSPHTTGVVYTQEFSPWRSPELMGQALKIFLAGVVAGVVIFCLLLVKTGHGIVDSSDPRVQPTVTVTSTPVSVK